ncbi:MAG: ABC transporter permease [Acidimicrobiia bacterium]|nr:ABC transporter permease [Acidimicrobiia bacterium]
MMAIALFALPLVGLVTRTPWNRLVSIVRSDVVVDALWLSAVSSVAAAVLSVVFGVPLAWLLARVEFQGRDVVRALVTLPMVLPPVVGGTALLLALGRRGIAGEPVNDATGFLLPFSIWGVIVANTFVAMPFLVITVEGALRNLDPRYETAAATLGATPLIVFRKITIPAILPALRAGAVIAWARSLGEFGATVTFAGNLQGRTQTLPLAVFVALESDRDTAIAISLILVVVSFVVLVGLRDRWWGTR